MILIINFILVCIGLVFCTFLALSRRYSTKTKSCVTQLALWVALWMCLLFGSSMDGFEPNQLTTAARTIALIINIWYFKNTLINAKKERWL